MARGELLKKLLLSQRRGNIEEFRSIALEIIAEEDKKNNHHLARDLMRILENSAPLVPEKPLIPQYANQVPKDRERQTSLIDVRQPTRTMQDIILSKESSMVVERILEEYRKSELLRVHGLRPATKLLFCGPPGCGKTLCAEVIAFETGLPLLYTRFDAIVSSYLGETSANLRKVFDYATNGRWVVLFDEFDAIGKARDDATEHGELKRVINSFLQLLDGFSAPSIVIAATNHEQLLDPALWRRFDEIHMFPLPSQHEICLLLEMKLKNFRYIGLDLKEKASKLKGMSHADVERVCFDAIKAALITNMEYVDQVTFDRAIDHQWARIAVMESAAKRRVK